MDREWREAIDMRSSLLSVGLVLMAAAVLRFWNLRHGPITPIESEIVAPVLQLMQAGSYRPTALSRPTLPVYLQTVVASAHFIWGVLTGVWVSVNQFGPRQAVVWGRACSALLGIGVVFMVYQIGMRWGARHGLLAAGLMAVTPMHVAASREAGDGAPLTFFSALTLLVSLTAIERGGVRRFAIAGGAAGLAAASHYAGAAIVLVPLVAAWMTTVENGSRLWSAVAVLASAALTFVAGTPLSVRDLPSFLNGLAIAAAPTNGGAAAIVKLLEQLVWTMQWPGVVLAAAGIVFGLVRAVTGPGHSRWTLLVFFPVVYFAAVAWHGATSPSTLLPLLPSIAVVAAIAVVSGVSLLRRFEIPRAARTALIARLTIVAVLPPALFSIELVRQAGHSTAAVRP